MIQGQNKIFKNIRSGPLAKIVMEQIKEALIKKELRPGDRLPTETELCESLGVGKSSVREAIKMLDVLGVVQTRQGDGTYISSAIPDNSVNPLVYQLLIDYGSNDNVLELRSIFEPAYTLLAAQKATEADLGEIRKIHEDFREKVSRGEQTADDDLAFHNAILRATHNPFVIRIGLTVMQLFREAIGHSMKQIPERAVRDHEEIYQAFIRRDPVKLQQAVLNSFDGWVSMMDAEDDSATI